MYLAESGQGKSTFVNKLVNRLETGTTFFPLIYKSKFKIFLYIF